MTVQIQTAEHINKTAAELLEVINAEYRDIIDEYDYLILVQSCKKLMEVSTKLMTPDYADD